MGIRLTARDTRATVTVTRPTALPGHSAVTRRMASSPRRVSPARAILRSTRPPGQRRLSPELSPPISVPPRWSDTVAATPAPMDTGMDLHHHTLYRPTGGVPV